MDSIEATTILVKTLLERGMLGLETFGKMSELSRGEPANFAEVTAKSYKIIFDAVTEASKK